MSDRFISIVIPVYKAENIIDELIARLFKSVTKITENFEIILVDDGSPDNSWNRIKLHCQKDNRIIGIELSRNFGQHYAITAGLDHSTGDWVVVMDCDLQDQPEEIQNLYNKAVEGYDIVLAKRINRKDSIIKKILSKLFYRTLGYLTGSKQDETVANFGIYNKKVVKAVISMRESIRYFPTMVKWVGFNSIKIVVEHNKREYGKSNYNFKRLISLASDIILSFSDKPIKLLIKAGLVISVISIFIALIYFFKWLKGEVLILGYTSLIISIWLLSGVIISTLGLVGLYIGKIFEGVKKRPIYIINKIINDK